MRRAGFILLLVLGFGPSLAAAYSLPPEKALQYWTQKLSHLSALEVRAQHILHEGIEGTPEVAEATLLYRRPGRFRLLRTGAKGPWAAVLQHGAAAAAQGVVRGGVRLSSESPARYWFAYFFAPGAEVLAPERSFAQEQGVLLDHPPTLWLLSRLSEAGVPWQKTRLAPYGGGKVALVLGIPRRGSPPPSGLAALPGAQAWFDNRDYFPVEFHWTGPKGTPYKAIFSEYKNDIVQYYPKRVALWVNGELAEEFVLLSVRENPPEDPAAFDLGALLLNGASKKQTGGVP
ncbi:MAG: hypothetical protein AB1405_08700 [Bdellovibrionota bacterium]